MIEQQLATTQLDPLPDQLDSPQAKLVYLYLEASGGATATDLNEVLAMKKIAVLSVLSCLEGEGLVEKNDAEYVVCN
ncbi:MarR family transcriptional regulator [Natronococcus sp. JC468]|uniref:MarR family transcriptional regulator n=1 Tax=Natronococcus sp. JC468 TaxID=1961921 RepID=UPI0014391E85|nr:MarR family transcriptional regulator [Natronococcus sp. JC468]NKE35157.1 MarR family transcriptional regulator [Natronococcus sp. JC468]